MKLNKVKMVILCINAEIKNMEDKKQPEKTSLLIING